MKTFYHISADMLPASAAGGVALTIDGQLISFSDPTNEVPWYFEKRNGATWAFAWIAWDERPGTEIAEEAFEATPGVVKLPLIWDLTAPAPPESLECFSAELSESVKATTGLTFDQLRKSLPRSRQRQLLPW